MPVTATTASGSFAAALSYTVSAVSTATASSTSSSNSGGATIASGSSASAAAASSRTAQAAAPLFGYPIVFDSEPRGVENVISNWPQEKIFLFQIITDLDKKGYTISHKFFKNKNTLEAHFGITIKEKKYTGKEISQILFNLPERELTGRLSVSEEYPEYCLIQLPRTKKEQPVL